MSCEQCKILAAKLGRIRDILEEPGEIVRGRSARAEVLTEHGRLIAAAATARGLKLSDVSDRIGRAPDYVARVCRVGGLRLVRSAALTIGACLGIDLTPFVVVVPRGGVRQPATPPSAPLPFLPGPCAADRAREAS